MHPRPSDGYLRAQILIGPISNMATVRLLITLAFLSIFASASDLATSYEQAAALGDAQEKAPATQEFFKNTLLPYYEQQYGLVLQSCFASVPHPDSASFSFVIAIDGEGQPIQLYRNRETNIFVCLREALMKDVFPKPPVSPYYLHIDMDFNNDGPPHSASTPMVEQSDQSLGAAARKARSEKAAVAGKSAPPDWAMGPPRVNHEPVSEAQLIGWVAGGVPSDELIPELHKRGTAFVPSHDFAEMLHRAGADTTLLNEVSKAERTGAGEPNSEEMNGLGTVLADKEKKDHRGAIRDVVALLRVDSKNPGLYILLGSLLHEEEEWTGMASAFSAAIQLDRDFAFSHGELSLACHRMGNPCAKSEAEAMLALAPRNSDAHKYLGLALMMMGDVPSALAEFQKALALGSKAPAFVYYDIGLAKKKGGDIEGAMEAYRKSIEFNPKDWRGYSALGSEYVHQGNIDEGVVNMRKAKSLAPDRMDVRQNIGAAFCNSGRNAEAIVEFQELLSLDPDWNMARPCLARSLRAVGRADEAQQVQDEYDKRESNQ